MQTYVVTTHLSDEDLRWMTAYNKNDTLFFISEINHEVDTLIIKDVYIKNDKKLFNSYPFSFRSDYQAFAYFSFILKHKGKTDDTNSFSIYKNYKSRPCFVGWNILGLINNNDSIFEIDQNYVGFSSGIRSNMINIYIGGNLFYDCIIGNTENSHAYNLNNPMLITEFIWNKEYGLLQYKSEEAVYTRIDIENIK